MRMSFLTFLTKKLMRPGHIMRQVMIHLAEIKLWSSCLKRLTYLTCTLGQNKWTSIGTFNVTEVEGDAWGWGSLILTHAHAHVTAQALSMNKKVMQPGLILRYDMACAWEKSLPMAGLHRTAKKSSRPAIQFFFASRPVPRSPGNKSSLINLPITTLLYLQKTNMTLYFIYLHSERLS